MTHDPIKHIRDRSTEDADCWLWRLACTSNGTPTMHPPGGPRRTVAVRRFLAAALGHAIAGKVATNTCCDPRCVAPHHLSRAGQIPVGAWLRFNPIQPFAELVPESSAATS